LSAGTQTPRLSQEQLDLAVRLEGIFMPYARAQRDVFLRDPDARFVHYTSAESAIKIIKSKRIWMRNTNCMADYREVQHGFDILNSFFSNEANRKAFIDTLDTCAPGAAIEAIDVFQKTWGDIRFDIYITCVSEHDKNEDLHGRLSMWRAASGNAVRVGMVFKIPKFSQASLALNLLFSPVAYLSEESAHKVVADVIANVAKDRELLSGLDRSHIVTQIFMMLLAGVVCLKHEGFHEAREWRAIYAPNRWPSQFMESSTEVIVGVPQIVYKIPLDATVSESLADLDLSSILERLIVGPSPYPWPIYEAFVAELNKLGIEDAQNRVRVSGIPIRV
jgi:hypothetical protein